MATRCSATADSEGGVLRLLLLATFGGLLLASAWLVGQTAPASAAACDHADEQDLVDFPTTPVNCRNFLIDPGRGNLVSRAQVVAHKELYTTGTHGSYNANFLWYAPEREITVTDPGAEWTVCDTFPGAGGACPVPRIRPSTTTILGGFIGDGPVSLHVFGDTNAFIAQACGNSLITTSVPTPTPRITGTKFHDRNRNGVRDVGEEGLAGWQIVLTRTSSLFGDQGAGEVGRMTTDANGRYRFDLLHQGPGTYEVTEVAQDGWSQTSPRITVTVAAGVGDREFGGNDLGNVENRTDVAKVSMSVVNPPAEFMNNAPTTLTVRSVITNRGPAGPVAVDETLRASGPADCSVTPAEQRVPLVLGVNETVTVDLTVVVQCSQPSFHRFRFDNALTVTTPGVTDVELANNVRTVEMTAGVVAHSDLAVTGLGLACPVRADRTVPFDCTASATIANQGPFGPAVALPDFSLQGPGDCAIAPKAPAATAAGPISVNGSVPVSQTWTVTCGMRSFHEFTATLRARPQDIHVRDIDSTDDQASTSRVVPVFERADLAAETARIVCAEVWTGDTFTCVLDATLANLGPADAVQATVTASLSRSEMCATVPGRTAAVPLTLAAGSRQVVRFEWRVTCPVDARVHDFTATVQIAAAEPHAEDLVQANNRYVVHWQPTDLKPNSDPNSINLKRDGLTSVAILATAGFDPFIEVDVRTLRYGPTGTEAAVVRCATEREDLNGDGLGDLSCKFAVAEAGFHAGDTLAVLTGLLRDGTPFMSADRVRVING